MNRSCWALRVPLQLQLMMMMMMSLLQRSDVHPENPATAMLNTYQAAPASDPHQPAGGCRVLHQSSWSVTTTGWRPLGSSNDDFVTNHVAYTCCTSQMPLISQSTVLHSD